MPTKYHPHILLEEVNKKGLYDFSQREDFRVKIRVNENISPGKFKPDPLIPGGYMANSLTIKAMRQDIFFLDNSFEELSKEVQCPCGENFDTQFWKLCPYCGKENF